MGKDRRTPAQRKMAAGGIRYLNWIEIMLVILAGFMLSGIVGYLFYDCLWVTFGGCIIAYPVVLLVNEEKRKRRIRRLETEFCDYMYGVSGALLAGYSLENAFLEALVDVRMLYEKDSVLLAELRDLKERLYIHEPLEKVLKEFAESSQSEDIINFVEVFCYAKRGGGDFLKIIETTIQRICDKIEIRGEIQTTIAQKALEQKVMSLFPAIILLFFKYSSPEFIDVLYGNVFGIFVMTLALFMYVGAMFWGMKIVEIEV